MEKIIIEDITLIASQEHNEQYSWLDKFFAWFLKEKPDNRYHAVYKITTDKNYGLEGNDKIQLRNGFVLSVTAKGLNDCGNRAYVSFDCHYSDDICTVVLQRGQAEIISRAFTDEQE